MFSKSIVNIIAYLRGLVLYIRVVFKSFLVSVSVTKHWSVFLFIQPDFWKRYREMGLPRPTVFVGKK